MPTLSLDRILVPLPNTAGPQMARPKLASHNHREYMNRIARNGDIVENDHTIDDSKTSGYTTSQDSMVVLIGDDGAVSSKTFTENPQQGRKDDGGNLNKEHSNQDIQRSYHLEQQRSPQVKHGPLAGAMVCPSQPPTRDREDTKLKDDPNRKKIQQVISEKSKHLDEQCNFPTVTPLVARNHNSNALPQQQPGYSIQHQQHNNTNAFPPSEQRPLNMQNGGGYTIAKKMPQQQQPQPSHHRPQTVTHNNNNSYSHYVAEQPLASGNTSILPASLQHSTHQIQSQPTLFFDRLVSEEVQEFKSYARIIESQTRRLAELESLHQDLETRLESSTIRRFEIEATLERQELEWTKKFIALEKECEEWKKSVSSEKIKNERLLDLVYRKDKEIQRMIQRKYDPSQHDHPPTGPAVPSGQNHNRQASLPSSQSVHSTSQQLGRISSTNIMDVHKSPHEILAANGSPESVRARNVLNALNELFGL